MISIKRICEAILKKTRKEKSDYRKILAEWMTLFEVTGVEGYNRDEFLDCFIAEKEKDDKTK